MPAVGYAFVREALNLAALPPRRPAQVRPVTRVAPMADHIAIPAPVAPAAAADALDHLLFALKHEGVNLAILMEACTRIPAGRVVDEVRKTPSGAYARLAGFLWEQANRATLADAPATAGAVVDLFDPAKYITGPDQRDARWRVNFNGLGTPSYCATVERTGPIQAAIDSQLLNRVNRYTADLSGVVRDRALSWAYLHETRDSFAIEREVPSEDRARAFVELLKQAHERRPLSEDYLTGLQHAIVSNRLLWATGFRHEQNHLANSGIRGSAGVTYVPPPPDVAGELMHALMAFANDHSATVDPLVVASVVSFGFVFIHPYMDGNGRLSRFLFHHALCRSGALQDGLILPVSVAMKKHEAEYLRTLQAYSRPLRDRWQVTWIDGETFDFQYQGDASHAIYRYWDATACVEFGVKMAEMALDIELRQETEFLLRYDAIVRRVNELVDLRGSDLSTLVIGALDNGGVVSKRRRDQFQHTVPAEAFDLIEQAVREAMERDPGEDLGTPPRP